MASLCFFVLVAESLHFCSCQKHRGSCRVRGDQICTLWLGHLGMTMSGMMGNISWFHSLHQTILHRCESSVIRHVYVCRIVYGAATAQSLLRFSCRLPSEGDALQSPEEAATFSAEVRPPRCPVRKTELTHLPSLLHSRHLTSVVAGLCFVSALQWAQKHLPDSDQRAPGPMQTAGAQPGGGVPLTCPPEAFHLLGRVCLAQ